MYKDPENLERTVKFVKSAMTNQRVVVGIKKTYVKRVTSQETEIEDFDPDDHHQASACLRRVYKKETYSTMGKFEDRLKKKEKDVKETNTNVKQILDIFTRNNTINREISPLR
jgi:glutaredoxin 2